MESLLIEPHYLGSIEYFVLLSQFDKINLEIHAHYNKQTFKNRTVFPGARGPLPLSVPVKYRNHMPLKEVRIDHSVSWFRDHWGAFYSTYGKAPFYEYFADDFRQIWEKGHQFLVDLNFEMMTFCLKLLQLDRILEYTRSYEKIPERNQYDSREQIHPKKPFEERKIYLPFQYTQVFGSMFVPNMSIVDLLMCEGNRAGDILEKSTQMVGEHLLRRLCFQKKVL